MVKHSDTDSRKRFDGDLFSVSEVFHENTKIRRAKHGSFLPAQNRGPLPDELNHALGHSFKEYRSAERIPLPPAVPAIAQPLECVLRNRRSIREFSGAPVSIEHLSCILELSYGISDESVVSDGVNILRKRTAPSAGALYPNEIYLVAQRVERLPCGLYHFQPLNHSLECLLARDLSKDLEHAMLYPEVVAQASVVFLLGSIFERARFKYGERGYRFVLLDAGHIVQNIYLVCTALGIGSVAMGGFVDDDLNQMIDLNGVDEAVVYTIAVGHPAGEMQRQSPTVRPG